jgi:hypothetical protein
MGPAIELTPDFLVRHAQDVERVLREAYRKAVDEHARLGFSVPDWRDGKVTLLRPDQVQTFLSQSSSERAR